MSKSESQLSSRDPLLWEKLAEAAKENQIVQVQIDRRDEIKRPKRPRGRPPVQRASRWSNYAGYNPNEQGRPRCAQPGCRRWLKRDQKVACGAEHEREVVAAAEEILARAKSG